MRERRAEPGQPSCETAEADQSQSGKRGPDSPEPGRGLSCPRTGKRGPGRPRARKLPDNPGLCYILARPRGPVGGALREGSRKRPARQPACIPSPPPRARTGPWRCSKTWQNLGATLAGPSVDMRAWAKCRPAGASRPPCRPRRGGIGLAARDAFPGPVMEIWGVRTKSASQSFVCLRASPPPSRGPAPVRAVDEGPRPGADAGCGISARTGRRPCAPQTPAGSPAPAG